MPLRPSRRAGQECCAEICLNRDIGEVMVIIVLPLELGYFLIGMDISTDLLSKKNHNSSIIIYL